MYFGEIDSLVAEHVLNKTGSEIRMESFFVIQ